MAEWRSCVGLLGRWPLTLCVSSPIVRPCLWALSLCVVPFASLASFQTHMTSLCDVCVPPFVLFSVHYWCARSSARTWTRKEISALVCVLILTECVIQTTIRKPTHALLVLCVSYVTGACFLAVPRIPNAIYALLVVLGRSYAFVNLAGVDECVRPLLAYLCGAFGVVYARGHVRGHVMAQEGSRTRRRSANSPMKPRRTSLPAMSLRNHLPQQQSSLSCLDTALLAEAHGLITDMLADSSLPLNVVSGLRALSHLLSPPNHSATLQRPRQAPSIAFCEPGSDGEENPYIGEKLCALPKRHYRRNIPTSLLRRISTAAWTTTTSATGMPTLEPEPSRKRSASFRHGTGNSPVESQDGSSPTYGHFSLTHQVSSEAILDRFAAKSRSFSTTSLLPVLSSPPRRSLRERKTVCSLHPLTPSDINRLHTLSRAAGSGLPSPSDAPSPTEVAEESDEEVERRPKDPVLVQNPGLLATTRRLNVTSDYGSSESPSSSDMGEEGIPSKRELKLPLVEELRNIDLEIQTDKDERYLVLLDGTEFNLEFLRTNPQWDSVNEWDYPIFQVGSQSQGCILSQMCYRVFLEVGLFETFKVPLLEFLNYFRALESGYRDKPYHNRTHATDVLHAVYYFTSQPIPGFTQLPPEVETHPVDQSPSHIHDGAVIPGLVTRQSFNAEDTYGIMGANFPALELMALYVAAAMHDYDHPGRTNAFLVMTHAPQALLYNDRSVLENHHAASAWNLLFSKPEFNFLVHLDKAEFKRFRFLVIEAILATDLKRHFEILAEFNAKVNDEDAPGIDWNSETDRLLVMEMCIKLADINGPCKCHELHLQWTHRIADEFYEQGDEESSLGLAVSPFMDRKNPQLAKLQESFITHLVGPLCNSYGQAGLLPGQWTDRSEEEEGEEDETGNDQDQDSSSSHSDEKTAKKKQTIKCLQTKHLKDNYDYWIKILDQEEGKSDESSSSGGADSEATTTVEMETIDEEEGAMDKGSMQTPGP